jgi:serine/threonine protein phosphatase PrpC
MKKSFLVMQTDLTNCEIDCKCSGATCVIALMSGNKLSIANCGDSRAILGRKAGNGQLSSQAVSNDHKPDRPEERKRILAVGGHLGCRQVTVNQPGRGPVSMPVGPCRIWYQHRGETLGLAMSRSLGDLVVHKSGCSAEPEIIEHTVDNDDMFLVIATDGVWDVMDNNQVVQLVYSFACKVDWNAQEAASAVTKYARSRWEKMSQMVDDITCVVVKLK